VEGKGKEKATGVHDERQPVFVQVTADNSGWKYSGRIWVDKGRWRTFPCKFPDDWGVDRDGFALNSNQSLNQAQQDTYLMQNYLLDKPANAIRNIQLSIERIFLCTLSKVGWVLRVVKHFARRSIRGTTTAPSQYRFTSFELLDPVSDNSLAHNQLWLRSYADLERSRISERCVSA
jgi:hypothetical protein